ncbi:MAG: acyl carrier protein [Candidatus Diapherotrites archaeon]|nr:acyl carrier protein [Candidatus Diapherotrites archaeon]
MKSDISIRLNKVFRDFFGDKTINISPKMTPNDFQSWDSLNHIKLIDAIEKEFGVKMSLKQIIEVEKVGDIINFLEKRIKKVTKCV